MLQGIKVDTERNCGLSHGSSAVRDLRPAKKEIDSHLRSTRALAVYSVEASEHWYDEKKMMIPTGKVSRISYEDEAISVDATKRVLTAAALSASS